MRIVIPSSTDWLQSADFNAGTVLVEGRLAEMLHPELWRGRVGAWSHALDSRPWDYSGRGNHGTRVGGVSDREDGWLFDGTTGGIHLASPSPTVEPMTMAGWFNVSALTGTYVIVGLGNNGATGFYALYVAGAVAGDPLRGQKQGDATGNGTAESSVGVSVNTWHHGCAIFSTASQRVLLAGGSEGSDNDTVTTTPDFMTIGLLKRSSEASFFSGRIGEVAVWNRVLTDTEIALLADRRGIDYECRVLPRVFSFQ